MTHYTPEDLDAELRRRQHSPPYFFHHDRGNWVEEWTTAAALRAEFAQRREDLAWQQWELALAERQEAIAPGTLFYRIVVRRLLLT